MPIFWRVLIINRCWILSKAFSSSIEIIMWFLSFNLLIWCMTLIDSHIGKNPCFAGINPTWSWCMSFWWVGEFCLLKFCWGFLHLCSSVLLAFFFFFLFFGVVFVWFLYQGDGGLGEWVWKCPFHWNFFFSFIFVSWRLITLQYCSGFCHTLTWISHGFTRIPHPDPPSHLPLPNP